jgi:UDP-galactopyranose mutase
MSRFAEQRRVFFIEEPSFDAVIPELRVNVCTKSGVHVISPAVPERFNPDQANDSVRELLRGLIQEYRIDDYVAWFYTPMALGFAAELQPALTVYDCMDELSLFQGAPPLLVQYEELLFKRANKVFTGGYSLFEAKCERHAEVYAFPSSVDVHHFSRAHFIKSEPPDQQIITHPRIGYAGVIDERIDAALIAQLSEMRPEWQIVMIGPVVKISPAALPKASNIHYLGMKPYADLPTYFSGWDAAMLPFALNESTRFISPTKTPEYLAAGLPVISTPIRDVVRPYQELGLARIAATAEEFAAAMDHVLTYGMSLKWRERAHAFLSTLSWDKTWSAMNDLIVSAIAEGERVRTPETVKSRIAAAGAVNV